MRKPISNPIVLVKPRRQWTDGDREDILARYDYGQGQGIKAIARVYDVEPTTIRNWLISWDVYNPKPYKPHQPANPKKEEQPLDAAMRILGERVKIDFITDDIKFYYLDGKKVNPYYLIPAAGLCKGRAWV